VLGLQFVRREGKSIYFRGDDRDHALSMSGDPRIPDGWTQPTRRRSMPPQRI
jgi:hypothetical protein